VSRCGILNISQSYRPPRPVTRIALLFYFILVLIFQLIIIYIFSAPLSNGQTNRLRCGSQCIGTSPLPVPSVNRLDMCARVYPVIIGGGVTAMSWLGGTSRRIQYRDSGSGTPEPQPEVRGVRPAERPQLNLLVFWDLTRHINGRPCNRPRRPVALLGVRFAHFLDSSRMAVRLSTLRAGRPLPAGRCFVLISVRC
jgi:hypothetical protein